MVANEHKNGYWVCYRPDTSVFYVCDDCSNIAFVCGNEEVMIAHQTIVHRREIN